MTEHHAGALESIGYTFVGDGRSNVASSLLVTGALLGMDVRIGAPRQLLPAEDVLASAQSLASHSGARILITSDPHEAVAGADFVYTDVWVSMGESSDLWSSRIPMLVPFQVNEALMASSGGADTKFMHCLPAVHDRSTLLGQRVYDRHGLDGAEVTDAVFNSANSIVFDQAENRLHTIKAILVNALAR
jgi:ornithine carbamoyltransferase